MTSPTQVTRPFLVAPRAVEGPLLQTVVALVGAADLTRAAVLEAVDQAILLTGESAWLMHDLRVPPDPGTDLHRLDDGVALGAPAGHAARVGAAVEVIRLALRAAAAAASAGEGLAEVESMRTVATRILTARELDEALSGVTHEVLALLRADIAGVMLRSGDEIVMRGCAGNRRVDTARLRMRRNQGLAGLVFATGTPAKVDDYVHSEEISGDFRRLAVEENTRSALGAPLIVDGDVIGVLEVWRRGPERFSDADIRRLVSLADLAAIAFENARLHEVSQTGLRDVERANRALEAQYDRVRHALTLQQELVQSLVDGERLDDLIRLVAERSGCAVQYFDNDLQDLGHFPAGRRPEELARRLMAETALGKVGNVTHWLRLGERRIAVRDVRAGADQIGWLCLTDADLSDHEVDLVLTQAGLACSLHHLQEQAAVKARATMREDMLLNLLQGSIDERRGAVARAKYLNVDLKGELRVCICDFKNLESIARSNGLNAKNVEALRRRLLAGCEAALQGSGLVRMIALQGDALVVLTRAKAPDELRQILTRCGDSLREVADGLVPMWGVSAATASPLELDKALEEAWTATAVAAATPSRSVAVFEELGILGLLLSGPNGANMQRFIEQTIGPVREYDETHGSMLLSTLRAYLDCQCSQQLAAEALFVHQKTVKYRLGLIERLTGLNLREHRDRMCADVAVRAADLS